MSKNTENTRSNLSDPKDQNIGINRETPKMPKDQKGTDKVHQDHPQNPKEANQK